MSAVNSASDAKALRSLAAKAGIKFIGVSNENLKKQLVAVAEDDTKEVAAKGKAAPAKKAKKTGEPAKATAAKKAAPAKKAAAAPAPKKELSAADKGDIAKLDTKKAKVITLRERGYSIHTIAEATDLHPTNVSRYIREAGLSTSKVTVPQERKDRIKATIASKKPAVKAVKAVAPKKAAAKPAAKPAAKKAAAVAPKKAEKNAGKKSAKKAAKK